jgi:hypothetical protein
MFGRKKTVYTIISFIRFTEFYIEERYKLLRKEINGRLQSNKSRNQIITLTHKTLCKNIYHYNKVSETKYHSNFFFLFSFFWGGGGAGTMCTIELK